jgi:hypothetical protein
MNLLPRFSINRPRWLLIVGPDLSNNDWGLTFHRDPLPPMGDWKQWRINWRVNIRWPIQISSRPMGPRRRLKQYAVRLNDEAETFRTFWTRNGAQKWIDRMREFDPIYYRWGGQVWRRPGGL